MPRAGAMREASVWRSTDRDWPAQNEQVVGLIERDGGFDEIAWWTRTDDGWYVSDTRGTVGHRDAMTAEQSRGPHWWQHAPRRKS